MEQPCVFTAKAAALAEHVLRFGELTSLIDEIVHRSNFCVGQHAAEGATAFPQCRYDVVVPQVEHPASY